MAVKIIEVTTSTELRQFITFPNYLYKNCPYFVPSLTNSEIKTLNSSINPAFEYCESNYWLAEIDNRIVGRIAGIINHRFNEASDKKYARFSWLDFINNESVVRALFDTFENWAKQKGMLIAQGPMAFTDLDREGLLVEGFDEMVTISNTYNYKYYPEQLEKLGYQKDVDWLQFEFDVPEKVPEKLERYASIVAERYHLHPLKVKTNKELLPYINDMFSVFQEAYAELYGFNLLTERQIEAYINQYLGFIRPEFVSFILDSNERMVAFGVSVPSLAKAMQKSKGKLFPFGFYHLLKALKKNDTIDLYLIGFRKEYQNKGVNAMVFSELTKAFIESGIKKAIAYPQLEYNKKVQALFKYYDGRQTMRRRCYTKELT